MGTLTMDNSDRQEQNLDESNNAGNEIGESQERYKVAIDGTRKNSLSYRGLSNDTIAWIFLEQIQRHISRRSKIKADVPTLVLDRRSMSEVLNHGGAPTLL